MLRSRLSRKRLVLNGVDEPEPEPEPAPAPTPVADGSSTNNSRTSKDLPDSAQAKRQPNERPTSFPTTTPTRRSKSYRRIMMDATAETTTSIINSLVNPATVPIRTSSRGSSIVNGGEPSSPPHKTPRKPRSMASVPEEQRKHHAEVDERQWLAQGRLNRNTISGPPSTFSARPTLPDSASSSSLMPTIPPFSSDPLRSGVAADLVNGISLGWSGEKENILKGPFNYLESHPGKDIRTSLISGFNNWLQVPSSSLRIITGVVTMLHTSSLLIDDVEDSSLLRRGVPVAHSIFGTAQTINSANYVYFCALQDLLKLNNPEAIRIFTEELLNLHRGQGMDLFWRDTLTCPSEDDYLEMVGNKTGGLFRLAIKLMCAESPSHHFTPDGTPSASSVDYVPLVNTIGLLFQILDDYKNLSDTTYTQNKGLCEDLTEGKFSFPIIHAIRSDPSNLVLVNILKQKTTDEDVKRYAVSYMDKVGSFAYTRKVIKGLNKRAMALVEDVDNGRGKAEPIKEVLAKLTVERRHDRNSQSG